MNTLTIKECTDMTVKTPAQHFLQSRFWAEFKKEQGWSYRQYEVHTTGTRSFLLTVLLRQLSPFGFLAYIPMGPSILITNDSHLPETAQQRGIFLANLAEKLVPLLPSYVFLIRFDPPWECSIKNGKAQAFSSQDFPLIPCTGGRTPCSLRKAASDIQPPDTTLIDLTKSEDELLSAMRSKWRYNIRLAQKKGVVVRAYRARTDKADNPSLDSDASRTLDIFYELYKTTASRDGIAIHAKKYYEDLFALSASHKDAPLITVYIASHEGENLASIITLFSKSEAVYLYGASSNAKRNLMPAYLLQWTAICDAKSYGSAVYDFYGMPPSDDKNHPMYGLYLFKTGFGGRIVHRPGSLDFPLSPLYAPYAFAESARAFYHKRIKKILAGRAL